MPGPWGPFESWDQPEQEFNSLSNIWPGYEGMPGRSRQNLMSQDDPRYRGEIDLSDAADFIRSMPGIGGGRRAADRGVRAYEDPFNRELAEIVRRRDQGDIAGARQQFGQAWDRYRQGVGQGFAQGGKDALVAQQSLNNPLLRQTADSIAQSLELGRLSWERNQGGGGSPQNWGMGSRAFPQSNTGGNQMPGWLNAAIQVLSRLPGAGGNAGGVWPTAGINPNEPYPGPGGGQTGGRGSPTGQGGLGGDWDWLWNILYGGANLFGSVMSERERTDLQNYIKERIATMDERGERREAERSSILQGALPSLYRGIGYSREQAARQMMNSPFMQNRVPGQGIQGAGGLASNSRNRSTRSIY